MTLGSNKLKEKTIYDEKQLVAIAEQRQYDLLSNVVSNCWSFGLLKVVRNSFPFSITTELYEKFTRL